MLISVVYSGRYQSAVMYGITSAGVLSGGASRTLVILKPEVIERRIIGAVLQYFDTAGFKPVAMSQRRGSECQFREHYKDVITRVGADVGNDIIRRMTRGDCIFIIYEGNDAIAQIRALIGSTDPAKAMPGTIRHKYGASVQYNVVHASDSPESARDELDLWFPEIAKQKESSEIKYTQYNGGFYTGC